VEIFAAFSVLGFSIMALELKTYTRAIKNEILKFPSKIGRIPTQSLSTCRRADIILEVKFDNYTDHQVILNNHFT